MVGIVVKSISGFYYVKSGETVYETKAKGIFRKENISPASGDQVEFEVSGSQGVLTKILPRKNYLVRPPVSNIDQMIIVVSTSAPAPNFFNIDKLTTIAEFKEIEPMIVITKIDLETADNLETAYRMAGYRVLMLNNLARNSANELIPLLAGKLSVLTGNSGVGKTSLLNNLFGFTALKTDEISEKLGRGKHTTRQVELYPIENNGFIADTPGFSTIELGKYDHIKKDKLQYCFKEFEPYIGSCRFQDCLHEHEVGCQIIDAVGKGLIASSRYQSYVQLLEEIKSYKEWELT